MSRAAWQLKFKTILRRLKQPMNKFKIYQMFYQPAFSAERTLHWRPYERQSERHGIWKWIMIKIFIEKIDDFCEWDLTFRDFRGSRMTCSPRVALRREDPYRPPSSTPWSAQRLQIFRLLLFFCRHLGVNCFTSGEGTLTKANKRPTCGKGRRVSLKVVEEANKTSLQCLSEIGTTLFRRPLDALTTQLNLQ